MKYPRYPGYVYQPPRPLEVIAAETGQLGKEIVGMLGEVV
jgi:hypothetical protein